MTWIPWFYGLVAVLSFAVGIVNVTKARANEKIFAIGALLMPVGFALWAYGYRSGFAFRSATAVQIGTVCCLAGVILYAALTIRRNKASR
ncbi:MAG TPA: hypothetical protein VIJ12_10060 [Candidatus Baltobacteraceae bacterium]